VRLLVLAGVLAWPVASNTAFAGAESGWIQETVPGLERFFVQGASDPEEPVQGPDGAVWFDVEGGIGRIAADGTVTVRPTPGMQPFRLTVGPDGAFWFVDANRNAVGRMDLSGAVTLFDNGFRRGAGLLDIAAGADGNLWITDRGDSLTGRPGREAIWRLTPEGQVTELPLRRNTFASQITRGPDGNMWFTTSSGAGRVTPGGVIRLIEFPTTDGQGSITSGPDGNIWITEDLSLLGDGNHLVRLQPDGTWTFVPTRGRVHNIATGPDGNLWFTLQGRGFDYGLRGSGVGRMAPNGAPLETWREPFGGSFVGGLAFDAAGTLWGTLEEGQSLVRLAFSPSAPSALEPLLARGGAMRGARALATGPDGSMWITAREGILRVDATGRRTLFRRGLAGEAGALLPASGAVWFTHGGRGIARLNPDGSVRRYVRGFPRRSRPDDLAFGPDGAVWFIDRAKRAIGRMSLSGRVHEFTRGLARRRALLTITAGPDRRMWITDQYGAIDAISMSGRVQRFTRGLGRHPQPTAITTGPDGNLWFTQYSRRRIGRITPLGKVRLWRTREPPASIAAGPDGALWFTTSSKERDFIDILGSYSGVGRITTAGTLREFPVRPVQTTGYRALAAGPEGKVWFLLEQGPIALASINPQRLAELGELPGSCDH